MDTVFAVAGALFAAALVGWWQVRRVQAQAKLEREDLEKQLRRELDFERREIERKAEIELSQSRSDLEKEFEQRRSEVRIKEDEAVNALLAVEKERELMDKRRSVLEDQIREAESREDLARQRLLEYRNKLNELSDLSRDEVREQVRTEVERECEDEIRDLREERLRRAISEVDDEARKILLASMQRLSNQPHHDITATTVKLPSEDLKGRIIGREGRNIKAFESSTGTTLLIDETPDSVLISSFDPVRREVARIALEALLRDGRIHPASIEDAVIAAEGELQRAVISFGEEAVRQL